MIKNNRKQLDVKWEIREIGNWNYKNPTIDPVYSKPIAVIKLDGDEFVFCHDDILEIINAYHQVDKRSIEMIKSKFINTGEVKTFETPLLDKILNHIKIVRSSDSATKPNPYFHNGQRALR